ncbi:MAG: response regulator transcription factor [Actinomycetota bacterium]|nr:response regulator transcription factor [Actinomycetota bacterium]
MDSPRIAVIIEDDADIRDLIHVVLSQSGFEVHAVNRGVDGVEAVRAHNPSVVTLDLGLADIDGFEVARRIRLFSDSYIIMLSARAEELDTLMGLESGADDYLTKPFRPRELRARVAAMLRRPRNAVPYAPAAAVPTNEMEAAGGPGDGAAVVLPAGTDATSGNDAAAEDQPQAAEESAGSLTHNGLFLNDATRTALVNGSELELTRTEFDLLHALMESGKRVRTKAELVRRLRAEDYNTGAYISEADERTIEVHMANLRRKLGDDSRAPRWVKTVRGVGYQLAP